MWVALNCSELSTREINSCLQSLPDGASVVISEPRGRHNLAVGLTNHIDITIEGNAGYFTGGLCAGPDITVNGFVGWSVGENLMEGAVSACVAAHRKAPAPPRTAARSSSTVTLRYAPEYR